MGRQSPSPSDDAVEALAPLLSQPVVETCLAVPAWTLAGDRDRSLARLAFADRLPDRIRLRRSKGHMTSVYGRMLAAGLPRLRPWLLDGVLAQQGLIDRSLAENRPYPGGPGVARRLRRDHHRLGGGGLGPVLVFASRSALGVASNTSKPDTSSNTVPWTVAPSLAPAQRLCRDMTAPRANADVETSR